MGPEVTPARKVKKDNPLSGRPTAVNKRRQRKSINQILPKLARLTAVLHSSQRIIARQVHMIGRSSKSPKKVPHASTGTQTNRCAADCLELLRRFKRKGLGWIVINDEKRVLYDIRRGLKYNEQGFWRQNRSSAKRSCCAFGGCPVDRELTRCSQVIIDTRLCQQTTQQLDPAKIREERSRY